MPAMTLKRLLAAVAVGLSAMSSGLEAQEKPAGDMKAGPPPVRRFFDRPIDYWQNGLLYEDERKPNAPASTVQPGGNPKAAPSEWGQLVKQPDGTMAYHELPRQLIDVLEDPSPEKIRAYFEWKLARTQKIIRAAEAMKDYKTSLAGGPGAVKADVPHAPQAAVPGDAAPQQKTAPTVPGAPAVKVPFTVTYFHRGGCPHCDTQDAVLGRWLKDKPEAKILSVEFGEKPELWQRFQVRGTPSLVIEASGMGNPVFLEGVSQEAELAQALLASSTPPQKKTSRDGGEKK